MKFTTVFAAAFLLIAPPICLGQMTPDEAAAALAQREAAHVSAATQPDELTSELVTVKAALLDSQKRIEELQSEVRQLRVENASLKKQVAANPIITPPSGQKLAKGMTKAQVLDVLGKPSADQTTADGTETIEWNRILPKPQVRVYSDPTEAWMGMQNGNPALAVTEKTRWSLGHDIVVSLQGGKLVDFTDTQQN